MIIMIILIMIVIIMIIGQRGLAAQGPPEYVCILYVCVYIYIYRERESYIYMCIYVHIYIYIYIYTHRGIHIEREILYYIISYYSIVCQIINYCYIM